MAPQNTIKTIHRTTYPAISPLRPDLSTKGKNAIITGGGSGIGSAIAKSFAASGVSDLALLGRTEKTLLETKAEIAKLNPETTVWTYRVDISNEESTTAAVQSFAKATKGTVDVLVANAGYMPETKRIVETDADDWLKSFEISVRGNFNLIRAFHPLAAAGASVVHVSTAAIHLEYMEGFSGYRSSKIAAYKLFQWYAYENPNIAVVQYHPGLIMDTAITRPITGIIEEAGLIPDDISLPGDFAVWAASDEAKFLSGRFVWATWDVDELKATKDDVAANWDKFTMGPIP